MEGGDEEVEVEGGVVGSDWLAVSDAFAVTPLNDSTELQGYMESKGAIIPLLETSFWWSDPPRPLLIVSFDARPRKRSTTMPEYADDGKHHCNDTDMG